VILHWEKHHPSHHFARMLRAATQASRPSLDGHCLNFHDLAQILSTEDGHHIVLTHREDTTWQYWRYRDRATLISCHPDQESAQQAAFQPWPDSSVPLLPGHYVLAQKHPLSRTIRVKCLSSTPRVVMDIFTDLGYTTTLEDIAA